MPGKEITPDGVREKFLDHVAQTVEHWLKLPGKTERERVEGAIFGVLVAIDGEASDLPKFILAPDPHPDDREYNLKDGRPWWPENHRVCVEADISGALHERFSEMRKGDQ